MKKKQFEALCKTLLPDLPGFACKGRLLYAQPIGHVLRGFCCDDSSFNPEKFAVTVFFLPLYVPTKHLHFNTGIRLKDEKGCDIWWNLEDELLREEFLACIRREGLPFLQNVAQPRQVVATIQQLGPRSDPYRLEAIAYSLAMADEYVAAQSALDRFIRALDVKIVWQAEMMERGKALRQYLERDPQGAKRLLEEWEQISLMNLDL
jgi:hypothetical protein